MSSRAAEFSEKTPLIFFMKKIKCRMKTRNINATNHPELLQYGILTPTTPKIYELWQ